MRVEVPTNDPDQLALAREMRQEGGNAQPKVLPPMRASTASLFALLMIALCGCNDPVRVQSFVPGPGATFTYTVRTNTVITPNEDGAAEEIRRTWLAQTLGTAGMCNGGYVIYRRELVVPPERPAFGPTPANQLSNPNPDLAFGNSGDVVYTGSCL
jgi:hypothetical protein